MMFDLVGMDPRGSDAAVGLQRPPMGFPRYRNALVKRAPRALYYSPGAGGVDPLALAWRYFTLARDTGKSLAVQQALYTQYANLARSLGVAPAPWGEGARLQIF